MKSHLVSLLAMRHLTSKLSTFVSEHPGDWLIWEPGSVVQTGDTTVPFQRPGAPIQRVQGEALALQLEPMPRVTLGREPGNTLVVADGTLSAQHLAFHRTPQGAWSVEDLGSRNGTRLNGVALPASLVKPLKSGDSIEAAQCTFTFMTAESFLKRLQTP